MLPGKPLYLLTSIFYLLSSILYLLPLAQADPQEPGTYTTAAREEEKPLPPEMAPAPYTEFTSFKPAFTEEPLEGGEIDLSREDVENVYREFKAAIVDPPYPAALANPADYRIDDPKESFDKCAQLCKNINKLIFSVSDASLEKYGPFLQAMRDVVYLDAVCIKEYNEGNAAHRQMWHSLHNRWLSAVEERYAALPAA